MVTESLEQWAERGMELAAEEDVDAGDFDREWALALVARAVEAVEAEFAAAGMAARFAVLRRFLPGAWTAPTYEEAAAETGLSLTALKSAVLRLRGRFREQLRAVVATTVAGPHEVDEELNYLRRILTHAL
jgi:RNA polymerase sigma-70 factor (ECF subfamily)